MEGFAVVIDGGVRLGELKRQADRPNVKAKAAKQYYHPLRALLVSDRGQPLAEFLNRQPPSFRLPFRDKPKRFEPNR